MPEYELVSRKYFKFGEKNVLFVRVNGDRSPKLADGLKAHTYPSIFIQR